ncbi:MAG: ABC transporter permease [Desulfuromonas sp.]|nr:MAG: ABC transporter permease [Desulfuromonas sp.]
MRLETIVLQNLTRRLGRTAFLLIGLMIGVTTVVTLLSLSDALSRRAQHELERFGANIVVTPKKDQLELSYGGIQLGPLQLAHKEIDEAQLAGIQQIPNYRNLATIAPKVLGAVALADEQVMLMGVEPRAEFKLKRWWTLQGRQPENPAEVVAGSAVAERYNLRLGQEVELSGRNFTLVGLLNKTGSQDDHLLIAPLPTAQSLLHKEGQISMVELAALCHDCPVEEMAAQLRSVLPDADVNPVQQVVKTRMHALGQFRLLVWGIALTVIAIGALLVFITMMGAISERTREIGIYRAIGYRRSHILRLVLAEAGIVSAFAGVLGYLVGVAATWGILPLLDDGSAHWSWNPVLASGAIGAAVVVGLLATLQPAFRASRLEPSAALKSL